MSVLKKIYSLYADETGSAYLYVLFVMMATFLILRVIIATTSHSVLIANAAYRSSNLYHMAKSGIDKGTYALNNIIFENKQSINRKVLEDIQNIDLRNNVTFISDSNVHSGNFYLESNFYNDLFRNHANSYISRFLQNTQATLSLEVATYSAHISIHYDILRQHYIITSVATHEETNISVTLEAIVIFNIDNFSKIVHENYSWHHIPTHFSNTIFKYADFHTVFNNQINLNEHSWSYGYPLIFNTAEDLHIDISRFYTSGIPSSTIIIHSGLGNLYIYASNENNNKFSGVIVSSGNIIFSYGHYIVEGNLISAGNIYFHSLEMILNNNILLDINFENKEDKRILLDSLFLTNFFLNNGSPLSMLNICSSSSIELKFNTPISLRVLHITKQT